MHQYSKSHELQTPNTSTDGYQRGNLYHEWHKKFSIYAVHSKVYLLMAKKTSSLAVRAGKTRHWTACQNAEEKITFRSLGKAICAAIWCKFCSDTDPANLRHLKAEVTSERNVLRRGPELLQPLMLMQLSITNYYKLAPAPALLHRDWYKNRFKRLNI